MNTITVANEKAKLLAFHGNPKIKKEYLNRVKKHQKLDEIIHGTYWENGKGCAVGCTIHSSDHSDYETELGISRRLAHLEDRIFEGLDNGKSKEWPAEFLAAIKPGADLNDVWNEFAIWLLTDPEWGVIKYAKTKRTKLAIGKVAQLYVIRCTDAKKWYNTAAAAPAPAAAAAASYAAASYAAASYAAAYAAACASASYAAASYAAAYAAACASVAYAAAAAAAAADAAYASAYASAAAAAAAADAAAADAADADAAAAAASDAAAAAASAAAGARQKHFYAQSRTLLKLLKAAPVEA